MWLTVHALCKIVCYTNTTIEVCLLSGGYNAIKYSISGGYNAKKTFNHNDLSLVFSFRLDNFKGCTSIELGMLLLGPD